MMAAVVSRYFRQAQAIIANTSKGRFPQIRLTVGTFDATDEFLDFVRSSF